MANHGVNLGEEYVDEHTGYRGRATSITYYEYGCERVGLESIKDGAVLVEVFDIPRLRHADTLAQAQSVSAAKTGGDRPSVGKRPIPGR